ncbi:hypothetical protein [Amnibacterium sp.]|uniref:hypothetical protein n=1 Tax=Amnibacterium sp. TaxID=1872496 RepID=UPI00260959F5|nr:hypothetical protein [Amnibacterium sp.]MCU1473471.1 hypothetical protein [Amnibacterium sp.]
MAEPTPAPDGAPVPSEDTETGRAKHASPPEEDVATDRPAVARAATGPDAAGRSADEPAGRADGPATGAPTAVAVPARPGATDGRDDATTDEPRNETGSAGSDAASARADAAQARTDAAEARTDAAEARTERLDRSDDRTAVLPADERAQDGDRTVVLPADDRTPPAPQGAPVPMPPAAAPPPPRRRSNRLVGTAWVLLAALIFEVLYLAAFALVVLVVAGQASVGQSVQQLVSTPFAWLPVLLFALFYELTVLLLNRAGRLAYVLSSLIVAVVVYLLSTVLILALQQGGISNENLLGRALIAPQVVLIPIIAREVMLWTGLAVGARGRRVRRRNRAAQEAYERDRFASSVRDSDDGAGTRP